MKYLLVVFLVVAVLIDCFTQDIILMNDGELIKAIAVEVGTTEVKYKKANNPSGQQHVILKIDVLSITYSDGTFVSFEEERKELPSGNDTSEPEMDLYSQGQRDAKRYYTGYKNAGNVVFITTMIFPPAGLIPATSCSFTTPKDANLLIPSKELKMQKDYYSGYLIKAKRMKQNRIWTNWGIGLGVNLSIIALVVASNDIF